MRALSLAAISLRRPIIFFWQDRTRSEFLNLGLISPPRSHAVQPTAAAALFTRVLHGSVTLTETTGLCSRCCSRGTIRTAKHELALASRSHITEWRLHRRNNIQTVSIVLKSLPAKSRSVVIFFWLFYSPALIESLWPVYFVLLCIKR